MRRFHSVSEPFSRNRRVRSDANFTDFFFYSFLSFCLLIINTRFSLGIYIFRSRIKGKINERSAKLESRTMMDKKIHTQPDDEKRRKIHITTALVFLALKAGLVVGTGAGQQVNGALPSLPSPTMPNFNMAAQTPNGQPAGSDPGVYTNGIPQTYPGREYDCGRLPQVPLRRAAYSINSTLKSSLRDCLWLNFRQCWARFEIWASRRNGF